MQEDLLGYLLGALDADEMQRIECELHRSPALRRRLQTLRCSLAPLEAVEQDVEPPADLVESVWSAIDGRQLDQVPTPRSFSRVTEDLVAGMHRYALNDVVVLALVALVAITLFFPALANGRYEARKLACQNNLRLLGAGLISHSERQPDQRFPMVPVTGNRSFAGIYASTLRSDQLLTQHCNWLVCPGSGTQVGRRGWYIPTLDEVDNARGYWLVQLQHRAGGNYAYSVGYLHNGHVRPVRNRGRAQFVLLADVPSLYLPGRVSANHGGRGQNLCYEDGHVAFVIDPQLEGRDDPLRNRLGFAEVGVDRDDAVVLPSAMPPILEPLLDVPGTIGGQSRNSKMPGLMEVIGQ